MTFTRKPRFGHVLIPTINTMRVEHVINISNRSDYPKPVGSGARVRKTTDDSINYGDDTRWQPVQK